MLTYPPQVSALTSNEGERAAGKCAERGKDDGKYSGRGAGSRGSVLRAGNVAKGRIGHSRDAGSRRAS
jgi:hypothetical protein